MKSDIYIPRDELKPFIRIFVISESEKANTYKVLPGTEIVIGFQYSGKLSYRENDQEMPLSSSGLTGLRDSFRVFSHSNHIGSILVFFKEGGAPVFFKQPIHELFMESVSLDNFILRSELLILEEKLQETKKDIEKVNIVEEFLISRMNHSQPDLLVFSAISFIYQSKGNIRIKELTEKLHISQSPLEKRFRQAVGTSPKKFASIVRFKNTLQQYNANSSLTALGYEAGYYDQAHFIKEFKSFTGESPENFFSRKYK